MLGEDHGAASAGFRVGYEDPSYFSHEYISCQILPDSAKIAILVRRHPTQEMFARLPGARPREAAPHGRIGGRAFSDRPDRTGEKVR
jgi:hypothetical protein